MSIKQWGVGLSLAAVLGCSAADSKTLSDKPLVLFHRGYDVLQIQLGDSVFVANINDATPMHAPAKYWIRSRESTAHASDWENPNAACRPDKGTLYFPRTTSPYETAQDTVTMVLGKEGYEFVNDSAGIARNINPTNVYIRVRQMCEEWKVAHNKLGLGR
jgi:hypothetical protein